MVNVAAVAAAAVAIAAATCLAVNPVTSLVLNTIGFTSVGPAAGSTAAAWMASMGSAGGVAAGSWYAAFQSAAMGGSALFSLSGLLAFGAVPAVAFVVLSSSM